MLLVHYIPVGLNTDVLEIDVTNNAGAKIQLVLLTATLMQEGTVAGAQVLQLKSQVMIMQVQLQQSLQYNVLVIVHQQSHRS